MISSNKSSKRMFVVLMAFALSRALPALSATVTVTNIHDSGPGSLRQAIDVAEEGDIIVFDPDILPGTIILFGALEINKDLTIDGPGPDKLTISQDYFTGVFFVISDNVVTISGVTVTGSFGWGNHGAITNYGGALTVNHLIVSGNVGSGIYNWDGILTVNHTTVSDNDLNGGIFNLGTLKVNSSTISGNSALFGGGITSIGGEVMVNNSTISGNTTDYDGGGIYIQNSSLLVSHSTIAENSAQYGGGIYMFFVGGRTTFKNSIVANNGPGGNCWGLSLTDVDGVNYDDDGTCPDFVQRTPTEMNLGPLALDPSGTTRTHALLRGSVAIDAAVDCSDVAGIPVAIDQRGIERPQGLACDLGAFEYDSFWRNVAIDIKPGSRSNKINLGSAGTVPVAILSAADFDANNVDLKTVALSGATVKLRGNGRPMVSREDVNSDGLLDVIIHVFTEGIEMGDTETEAVLTGQTYGGEQIQGRDTIHMVP